MSDQGREDMPDAFDRNLFTERAVAAGLSPEAAAACAALFETFVWDALATKSHVAMLEAEVSALKGDVAAGTQTVVGALGRECGPLLTQKTFRMSINKMSYFTYLENLQFMVLMAAHAVVAALLLYILYRFL